ncbi:hypothetical protein PG995_012065 [Apiospora arundinis]
MVIPLTNWSALGWANTCLLAAQQAGGMYAAVFTLASRILAWGVNDILICWGTETSAKEKNADAEYACGGQYLRLTRLNLSVGENWVEAFKLAQDSA